MSHRCLILMIALAFASGCTSSKSEPSRPVADPLVLPVGVPLVTTKSDETILREGWPKESPAGLSDR